MYAKTIHFQQRTATGLDQSGKTTVWAYVINEESCRDGSVGWTLGRKPHGVEAVARITIRHPWLMAETREDVSREFIHAARDECRAAGVITVNDYGIEHPAEEV